MIKSVLFGESLDEIDELTLSSKGIGPSLTNSDEVLIQCTRLERLTLSFNKLTTLNCKAFATLTTLSSINIAHNQLTSLHGLSSLSNLTQLNISHNKLTSIEAITSLVGLTELLLQNNQLTDTSIALDHLKQLSSLQRLNISPNPGFIKTSHRALVLRSSPSLAMLDASLVTEEERTASSLVSEEEVSSSLLSLSLASAPSSSIKATSSPESPRIPRGLAGYSFTPIPLPSYATREGGGAGRPPLSSPLSHSSRRGTAGLPSSSSRPSPGGAPRIQRSSLPLTPTASRVRSVNINSSPAIEGLGSALSSPALILTGGEGDEGLVGALSPPPTQDNDNESVASFATSSAQSGISSMTSRSRRSMVIPKIKELPDGSLFQALVNNLPQFDASKLPKVYSPKQGKKQSPKPSPPESHEVVADIKYGAVYQSRSAVSWRADGSVASNWPNGDIAVTVDRDYNSPKSATESWRMFGMFKNGSVAVSWDSPGGGFVQYSNGSIALSVNSSGGTHYDLDGASVLHKWKWEDEEGVPEAVVVTLDPSSLVGARFTPATREFKVFMTGPDGLRAAFLCGKNASYSLWTDDYFKPSQHIKHGRRAV